jgi:hypothetical protein
MADVGRIVGRKPHQLFNLGETGNGDDCTVALSKPRTVFWAPLDAYGFARDWKEA